MKLTLTEFMQMLERGETPEEYEKRVKKERRMFNELYRLEDYLSVFDEDDPVADKKRKRFMKVKQELVNRGYGKYIK